jgi:vancomycin resistance protein YoaR
MTAGAATDAINQRLGATTIVLGDGGPTVTAAQLGAAVDARGLAESAFDARPMWNVTQWFGDSLDAPVTLDANRADAALRAALPSAFTASVPAQVSFTGTSYAVTPAVPGTGLDVDAIAAALHDAFVAGTGTVTVSASPCRSPHRPAARRPSPPPISSTPCCRRSASTSARSAPCRSTRPRPRRG